jgi:hypothetical protein
MQLEGVTRWLSAQEADEVQRVKFAYPADGVAVAVHHMIDAVRGMEPAISAVGRATLLGYLFGHGSAAFRGYWFSGRERPAIELEAAFKCADGHRAAAQDDEHEPGNVRVVIPAELQSAHPLTRSTTSASGFRRTPG